MRLSDFQEQSRQSQPVEEAPKSMRLGDFAALAREDDIPIEDGIADISDEQRRDWEARGKIGFMETWRRETKTRIPFLPGVPVNMIPFNPEGAIKSIDLMRAADRLRDPDVDANQRAQDEALVSSYLEGFEEERVRGRSLGGKVLKGVVNLPAYMLEFAATGPIAAGGRFAIKKSLGTATRRIVKSRILKATTRIAGGIAGATARTAAMPQRLVKGFADRQLAAGLELTDKGIKLADEVAEKPHISAMKAFGDVLIENFSEVTGPSLGRGASYLVPRRMKTELEKVWRRLRPGQPIRRLWTKGGYDGFLEEMGEEGVGGFLRAITGVEDFGVDANGRAVLNPDYIWDRIVASVPNGEEVLVTGLVIGVPGSLRMGTSQVIDLIRRRKQEEGAVEPELEELTDDQVDRIVEPKPEVAPEVAPEVVPEAVDEAQIALEALEAAEEALEEEALPEALMARLEEAGLDVETIEAAVDASQAALEADQDPVQAAQAVFEERGVEVPQITAQELAANVESAVQRAEEAQTAPGLAEEPGAEPQTPEEESARRSGEQEAQDVMEAAREAQEEVREEETREEADLRPGVPHPEALPPGPPIRPIRPGRQAREEMRRERQRLDLAVFPALEGPLSQIIAREPDFVKLTADAAAVVREHAERLGVEPTPDFTSKLWSMMHDILGELRLAAPADKPRIAQRIQSEFPDIGNEWTTLDRKIWSGKTEGYFERNVKGKIVQQFRPLAAFRRRLARVVPPPTPIQKRIMQVTGLGREREAATVTKMAALREVLRTQERAARRATRATRFTLNEVRNAQEQIIRVLEATRIAPEDRAKFIRTIKNIQSTEQFLDELPKVMTRVDELIESDARRKTVAAIKKELKTVRPRRVAGRLVGRFAPIAQEILTRMRKAMRMTREEAAERLAANLSANESGNRGIPGSATALENMILNAVANREDMTSIELAELLRIVRALKSGGRALALVKQFREQADIQDKRDVAKAIIDSRPANRIPTTAEESADDTKFGWYNRATGGVIGWDNLMNRLSWNDKSTKTNQSKLNKLADVSFIETAKKRGERLQLKKVSRMWRTVFGEMNDWQLTRIWAEQAQRQSLGQFINNRSEPVELIISKAEARKRWMEFQDPSLRDTIFGDNPHSMGWTEEMRRAVESFLSPQDIQFARLQMEFYRGYYVSFNEVYSDINGVNLPQNRFYSPIRRRVVERTALEDELLGEIAHRRSITPSAGKVRVQNLRTLEQLNDVEILQKHIQQIEHYKAWAKKIRILNGVFNDASVREAITANFGKGLLRIVDRQIEDFTRGGIDRSSDSALLNVIKNNYTVSVLSGKLSITVKQLMSFPAFADTIPVKEFMIGLADLSKGTAKKMKILASSEVMRSRGFNITPEMAEAVSSREWGQFQLSPNLRNLLLTLTRWGDRGAIYLGGWPVYRYHRFVLGKPHSEAIKEFEKALSSSQQSADLSQLSQFQRGNSWQRLFAVFLSAPNQYFRKEISATDDMFAGRITKQEWAKQIAIYHFILPMMFQFAADGLELRLKEQVRAGLLGSLNGIFIVGDILEAIISQALGLKVWQGSTIIDSLSREVQRAIRSLNPDDLSAEAYFEILKNFGKVAGIAKGLPATQAINLAEGLKQMAEAEDGAEFRKGLKRVAGWSEFVIDQGEKPEGAF